MTGYPEFAATSVLIADLGDHTYRLTFGSERCYLAVVATGSQLERWTREIREAIGGHRTAPGTW